MHPITPTLRAAAQSLRGEPVVRLRLQDRLVRWSRRVADASATHASDSAYTGGQLVRVRVVEGSVQTLRAADPTVPAAWTTGWATVAACQYGSPCALGVFAAHRLRAFFLQHDGAGAYNLRCLESDDDGLTWANEHTVVGGLGGDEHLAAAGDAVAVQGATLTLYREPVWSLTGWAWQRTWAGQSWSAPAGVAAAYDAELARWLLVVCGDGAVTTLAYSQVFSEAHAWRPAADQTPPDGSAPHSPAVAIAEVLGAPLYLVSWIDAYDDGTQSWQQPTVRQSFDWLHLGVQLPLDLPAAVHHRCALLVGPSGHLWAANETSHCLAYIPLSWLTAELTPSAFRRSEAGDRPGSLTLELLDPPPELVAWDAWAQDVRAYQPLAQVSLRRGYRTAEGDQVVAVAPYYILEERYRQGLAGGRLTFEAVDGWGLLDLWAPDRALVWQGRSIRWLLAELAAQVGLDYTDEGVSTEGLAALATPLTTFTLHPGQSLRAGVWALLRLAGCVARFTTAPRSALALSSLPLSEPAASLGDGGEILWADWAVALVEPTTVSVAGAGAAARAVAGGDAGVVAAMRQGLDLPWALGEARASSAELAERVRAHTQALAGLGWRRDVVRTLLRPELQPWDRLTLSAPPGAALCPAIGDDPARTVLALHEEWDAQRGLYTTTVQLGAD